MTHSLQSSFQLIIESKSTLQAFQSFEQCFAALTNPLQQCALLFPLSANIWRHREDEIVCSEQLYSCMTQVFSKMETQESSLIIKELSYKDEDSEVLKKFAMQKAFESTCFLKNTHTLLNMISCNERAPLMLNHDLLSKLIVEQNTQVLVLLIKHASCFVIKGENLDPQGICGTLIKQDQFGDADPLPLPQISHQSFKWKNEGYAILIQQLIHVETILLLNSEESKEGDQKQVKNVKATQAKSIRLLRSFLEDSLCTEFKEVAQLAIPALLANGFENEASFLLHQGVTPSLEFFSVALLYHRYLFALDFFHIFLKLTPPSPTHLTQLHKTLLHQFQHSSESAQFLILLLEHFGKNFNYLERTQFVHILKTKLQTTMNEEDNFLLYVRNPVKVLLLLNELLSSSLKLSDGSSHLSQEARLLKSQFSQLAVRILKMERSEEKTRLVLTDTDLKKRDVITIICENNEVDLLDHKYVEKLADEVWDGPYRVERSPLWLCTSAIAIESAFQSNDKLEGPLKIRDSFSHRRRNNRWNKISSFSFVAWQRGIMVRYGAFVLCSFLLTFSCLWLRLTASAMFSRIVELMKYLFNGSVDPTLIDNLVSYTCTPQPSYTLSTQTEDQQAIQFYQALWSSQVFKQTLESSLEFICLRGDTFTFLKTFSMCFTLFYLLFPITYLLQFFRCSRKRYPLSQLLCKEISYLKCISSLQLLHSMLNSTLRWVYKSQTEQNYLNYKRLSTFLWQVPPMLSLTQLA